MDKSLFSALVGGAILFSSVIPIGSAVADEKVSDYLKDSQLAVRVFPENRQSNPHWQSPIWFHGRYCGPLHSGPGKPVDLLDSRCRTHDICYANRGYFNRKCDQDLVSAVGADLHNGFYKGAVRYKAYIVMAVFWSRLNAKPRNPIVRWEDIDANAYFAK